MSRVYFGAYIVFAYDACFSSQGDLVGVEAANAAIFDVPETANCPSTGTLDLLGIPDWTRGAKLRFIPLP